MEYQYYVDQIKNQSESAPGAGLEVGSTNSEASLQVSTGFQSQSSLTSAQPEAKAPDNLLSPIIQEEPFCSPPLAPRRALPLVDAFRRRQRYVESLITCSSAALQCTMDGDTMSYLRFRAKNESIVCELTNARGRLRRLTGPLNSDHIRNWNPKPNLWLALLFIITAVTAYLFLSRF